ncbi:MAG: dihydroneopterin aldolase family protein [Thermoplasmata archaeon]|nr:dihydroneopterin aldolase family protein [Thermoplasmata archaeon]
MRATARVPSGPPLSPRERLLFEAGIKLGGVFHQYLGIPVTARTAPALARAIEAAVGLQPFVQTVRVRIDVTRGGKTGRGRYAYRYLVPEMLTVTLRVREGRHTVAVRLEYRPELRYPLMRVLATGGPGKRR